MDTDIEMNASLQNMPGSRVLDGSREDDYAVSFNILLEMIDKTLDEYKLELQQVIFPFFAVLYLTMIKRDFTDAARLFMERYKTKINNSELTVLESVRTRNDLVTSLNADRFLINKF